MIQRFYGDTSKLDMAYQCREDEADRLRRVFDGKSVCLVGNGESVLKHGLGAAVDQHDLVVRMNRFTTQGFELHVGSRTDVHNFTNRSSGWSPEALKAKYFYCTDGFLKRDRMLTIYNDDNLLFWTRPPGDYEAWLGNFWPTTGLRIILDLIAIDPVSVTIVGFDWPWRQYYYAPMAEHGKPIPAAERNYEIERDYIKSLVASDRRFSKL